MNNSFHLQDLLILLVCLGAGCFFAWLLYGSTKYPDRRSRMLLAAFRAFVIAMILWLLFAPLVRRISYTLEKPVIVIGQDNSLSVGHVVSRGFNSMKYQDDLKKLAAQLAEKYEVKVYHFSDSVQEGFDFHNKGKTTNATRFAAKLNDEMMNRNVGAVILLSDGIFNRDGNPLNELQKLKAPVYTIALGDTIPKKDILVANVNYNDLVYLNNDFMLDIQIQAFESKNEQSTLSVFENSKKVYTEDIRITDQAFVKNLRVKLKATQLGVRKYEVRLSPLKNELSDQNNSQVFVIDVIDDKQKILIAAAGPHPDLAVLKQSIEANRRYEVKTVLNKDLEIINPGDYNLVILYQLPSQQFNALSFLNKLQKAKLPLWYVLGAQSDVPQFNQVQSQVNLAMGNGQVRDMLPSVNTSFSGFDFQESYRNLVGRYDPLQSPAGKLSINGNPVVLLDQKNTNDPLLFFMLSNDQKTGYLMGEGIWRWRLSEAKDQQPEVLSYLISQSVQYLTGRSDRRKFRVYAAKHAFDENEHVILNAVLYNDNYQPVNTSEAKLQMKNEHGKAYNFTFSKSGTNYQMDAGLLPPGTYTYTAETSLGDRKYAFNGSFFVNTLVAEYQQTTANHQLLYTISAQTGGVMYSPEHLKDILNALQRKESVKTLSFEDLKYEELINFKWIFVLILALLSTEWFVRKRMGLQ